MLQDGGSGARGFYFDAGASWWDSGPGGASQKRFNEVQTGVLVRVCAVDGCVCVDACVRACAYVCIRVHTWMDRSVGWCVRVDGWVGSWVSGWCVCVCMVSCVWVPSLCV